MKEFLPYEQSFSFREKGFDEDCFAYYDGVRQLYICLPKSVLKGRMITAAPTYQQVIRWFAEKHKINVWLCGNGEAKLNIRNGMRTFNTWDEALSEAIKLIP